MGPAGEEGHRLSCATLCRACWSQDPGPFSSRSDAPRRKKRERCLLGLACSFSLLPCILKSSLPWGNQASGHDLLGIMPRVGFVGSISRSAARDA